MKLSVTETLSVNESDAVKAWLQLRRQYVVEEMHGPVSQETERDYQLAEERVAYMLTRLIAQ
jgi:hypothetical protein